MKGQEIEVALTTMSHRIEDNDHTQEEMHGVSTTLEKGKTVCRCWGQWALCIQPRLRGRTACGSKPVKPYA
jgi:hypothetical protein